MESTSPPKYARDDPHITRMSMTRQGWMPGGSCWCGATARDHMRQNAAGRWRCTKCDTRYRQRGDHEGLFLVSTSEAAK